MTGPQKQTESKHKTHLKFGIRIEDPRVIILGEVLFVNLFSYYRTSANPI